MNEHEWTKDCLMPLLLQLGFRSVSYVGGANEMGRDVVFAEHDRFGILRFYAAQVKIGNLGRSTARLADLVDQLKVAYQAAYDDSASGRSHRMSGVYLIVNGDVSDVAKRYLKEHTGQWMHVIDQDGLDSAKRCVGPRWTDAERTYRIALLCVDLEKAILPLARSVAALELDRGEVGLPASPMPIRNLEMVMDILLLELDVFDFAALSVLYNHLACYNSMLHKIPIGQVGSECRPSIIEYKKLGQATLEKGAEVLELLKHITRHPRPDPGSKVPPSGELSEASYLATQPR